MKTLRYPAIHPVKDVQEFYQSRLKYSNICVSRMGKVNILKAVIFTVTEVPIKSPTEYFLELSKPNRLMWEDEEPRQFSKRKNGRGLPVVQATGL